MAKTKTKQQLTIECEELRARLHEMEDTLEAIRSGAVDAIVTSGPAGDQVYTLEGADHAYHMMVESMNEGAVTLMLDGTILYGNRHFSQMTGSSPANVVGRRFHDFVSVSDQPMLNAILDQEGLGCPNIEIGLRNGPGADIPVQISASPIELGGAKALALVITDLSAQKRYEQIVADDKLSRRILEQAQEAIAVCFDGCIIRANKALHDICGCIPLMQPFDQIFSLRMSESGTFSVAMPESGKTTRKQEVRYQRPDGKIFDLVLSAGPIMGQENKVAGTLITMVDISDRKRDAEALQSTLQRFYTVLSSMHSSILLVSDDDRVEFANQAFCDYVEFQCSPADLRKLSSQEVIEKIRNVFLNPDEAVARIAEIVTRGKPVIGEEVAARGGGTYLRDFIPLYVDGKSYGRLWHHWDITEHKQAEEALRQANERLEQRVHERTAELMLSLEDLEKSRDNLRKLASELVMTEERERKRIAVTLHDEVAQTLAAAKMRLDLLRKITDSEASLKVADEAGELIVQSIRETRSLMNTISSPVLSDMGLPAVVQNLAEQASANYGLAVSQSVSGEFGELGEELGVLIYQASRELLQNVAKHARARSASVQVIAEDSGIRAIVTDDGRGFEVGEIGSPGREGGFGLFSIRERVKSFNGSMLIESTPGKGTKVTIALPRVSRKGNESANERNALQ